LSIFFKTPALAAVVIVLSTLLVFDGLRLVPTARLGREMRLKELAIFDGYRSFVSLIFSVPMALLGARYWTLVIGNVIAGLAITVLVLSRVPQRFARFHFRDVKTTLSYSSHFLTNQLAWYGYTNADFVVAARTLGKIAVGEYTLAWSIISAPADKIMAVFGRVMPIVLSNVQRDADAVRRYFLLFTEALAVLMIPASVGLAVVARDFVLLLFGAKWAAAVLPLRLLAIYIAIHILGTPTDRLLQSTGQAAFPARCRFVMLVILPAAFYLAGRRWGTSGIAAMWVTVYPILLLPMYARVFRSIGIRVRDYLATLAPTLVSTALMVVAVLLMRRAMLPIGPLSVCFAMEVFAGAGVFLLSAFWIQRRRLGILAEFMRTIRT
jgi:O-antigen/teichoic acid export membrane protein